MIKYLFEDNNILKSFDIESMEFIPLESEFNIDLFINHGIDLNTLNAALEHRSKLLSNTPRILAYSLDVATLKLKEIGLRPGESVELVRSIDFDKNYILGIKNIKIEADLQENDILQFIFSLDDGLTWVSYFNGDWINVRNSTVDILDRGMTVNTINSLNEEQLKFISSSGKLKIKFHMKKRSLESPLAVKKIALEYNTNL